ncbi:uncharacterized protein LOC101852524 [Aplysia californica]|uniref:Uncharacterized protein LOC101852524 n=1 Tax=Aplysia californica TaxID=6500 RepID=A0ABM0K9F8_APLCA|nr:uncharacterized protein LOC101852524 [Aplysia californica]XP_005112061.1 uncharacterized protein LOC101852524 [Aplysia californica]
MGGAVSSGQDNDELVDNLREDNYIKTSEVERVFRIVDRAHYYLAEYKDSAYKDLAWKCGTLHMSAPCIYSAVMEALELEKGMSFLNLGSGTGYLNTMVGFMIGPYGINHGIELHEDNVTYARKKLDSFKTASRKFDDLELCEPEFAVGNCLNLAPENRLYDRVYCGASCPSEQKEAIQNMIKISGILVVPVGDQLLKIRRLSETEFTSESVLPVSFASLVLPDPANKIGDPIMLPEVDPLSLQCICRLAVRESIRKNFDFQLPPTGKVSTSKSRRVKAKFLSPERGRYPLDILPTAQGLMIVGAFSHSDDDDDEDNDDEDEESDYEFLDRQLQRHAFELRRAGAKLASRVREPSPDEIDSDLSDNEENLGGNSAVETQDLNGNQNVSMNFSLSLKTPGNEPTTIESEDGVTANDEEEADDSKESHGDNGERENRATAVNIVRGNESMLAAGSSQWEGENNTQVVIACSSGSKLRERNASLSSEEDITSSASCAKSEAIEMAVSSTSGSAPQTIKSSYSTSADTSETSGFGSLGEDLPHLGLHQSLGSLKDDMSEGPSAYHEARSSSVASSGDDHQAQNRRKNMWPKMVEASSSLDEENEKSVFEQEESSDAGWMDIEDDDDDNDSEDEDSDASSKPLRPVSDDKMEEESGEAVAPRGPDFSAFLKDKVNTLPIPNSLKAFILYYR